MSFVELHLRYYGLVQIITLKKVCFFEVTNEICTEKHFQFAPGLCNVLNLSKQKRLNPSR